MKTQYQAILEHLRKHKVATVRDLLRYSNYPSARLYEMTEYGTGGIRLMYGGWWGIDGPRERIIRSWVQRNGRKVRLYCLVKA